jgi:general secretion pathway protein A
VPFDAPAVQRIHLLSRGVPRRINLLCDRALLGAYASGRSRVDVRIVDKAAKEVTGFSGRRLRWRMAKRWRIAAAVAGGLLVGAALVAAAWVAVDRWTPVAAVAPQRN